MGVPGRRTLLQALLVVTVMAQATGLRRNSVKGYSLSGQVCLSACRGVCVTQMTPVGTLHQELCFNVDTLQYFTTQWFTDQPLCDGPCGQFGALFDWCMVNSTTWDYCSAKTRTDIVFEALTGIGEHCAGPCRPNAAGTDSCKTRSGAVAACTRTGRHYIQAYTAQRRACLGPCERAGGGHALTCQDAAYFGTRQMCALPARVYVHVGQRYAGRGSQHVVANDPTTENSRRISHTSVREFRYRGTKEDAEKIFHQIEHALDNPALYRTDPVT